MLRVKQSLKVNVVLNIIKQCCAIIFPLITFPYVSRTLGVEIYGKINFSSSIISYISLLAGLGVYSYAVREGARVRDREIELEKFVNEAFSINVVSTVAAYALLAVLLLFWGKLEPYRVLILILSINVLMTTLGTDWINVIYEDFLYLTIRYIICQSMAVIMTLLFVKDSGDVVLYAFLSNFGTTLSNIINLFYIRNKLHIKLKFTFRMNLKTHLKPIMLLFGNMVSSMIYLYSDTTILGVLVGDIAVGYYTVASKIYFLVKQLINAASTVLTPKVCHDFECGSKENINRDINNVLGCALLLVIPIAVGIICMGKEIIIIIAGVEYMAAYSALAILSVALVFATFASITVNVLMLAKRKDNEILIASGLSAALNVILNLILIPRYSYNAAAFTTLISELMMFAIGMYYSCREVKIRVTNYLLIAIIGSVEVVLICNCARMVFVNEILLLIVCIMSCFIVYVMTIGVAYMFNRVNKT